MSMSFAGIQQVNGLATDADGLLAAPVRQDDRAVQDHVRQAFLAGSFQGLAQIRSLAGPYRDYLVEIAVGSSPRDAMVTGQCIGGGPVADQRRPSTVCQKQVSARLPFGVPRRRRSAASRLAVNCASSLGTSTTAR
jgi:hypothetical protein